ncbi:MAG: replicative DNA helicase [Sphingomonadales bacterium]
MTSSAPKTPSNDTEADEGLSYRQPPHNLEAEQMLLGAILVNNVAAEKVQGFLNPEHFYEPVHGRIFGAVRSMMERDQTADPVKLKPYFDKDEALKDVGGAAYLVRLAASAATIINAEDYGRTIYDLALRRELIQIGEDMVLTAYDSPIDQPATEQIEEAEHDLFELGERGTHEGGFKQFHLAMTDAVRNIELAYKDPDSLSGTTTGLKDLNAKLGGLHKSDLIILAGRPSMGKTALATNIAFSAALQYVEDMEAGVEPEASKGAVVGFFSLEMSADQLAARILAERSKIPSEQMRRGMLKESQFRDIVRAARELEEVPFYIDDTPALSIAGLRTRARRLKRTKGLSLVIVDYLQLLRGTGRGHSGESRVQEVSEITRGLKSLAKELQVPVLALSQLSRMVEQRDNKRPLLSDLRESGTIEQDADVVMFVYREEYYKEREKPGEGDANFDSWVAEMDKLYGKAEIIIGKQRHGPTGTVTLHFTKEFTKFSDRAQTDHLPEQIG